MAGIQPGETQQAATTRVFLDHRELLFGIVYNMLGSVADTEDVLQETWIAWTRRSTATASEPVASPRAYLVRSAVNGALARQESIARRREDYVGPWLPEPVITGDQPGDGAQRVERAESVSLAMLVVLETLTPLERAVFVLHEVFGYEHAEIAAILDRSPAAVRQVAHRAREHVHARRPRVRTEPRIRRQATERFVAAVSGGDLNALMQVLAPDVTVWADSGGKARAAGPRPVHGRDRVARLLVVGSQRFPIPDMAIRYCDVNGEPGAVLLSGGVPRLLVSLELAPDSELVSGVYIITNPDKLSHLG